MNEKTISIIFYYLKIVIILKYFCHSFLPLSKPIISQNKIKYKFYFNKSYFDERSFKQRRNLWQTVNFHSTCKHEYLKFFTFKEKFNSFLKVIIDFKNNFFLKRRCL